MCIHTQTPLSQIKAGGIGAKTFVSLNEQLSDLTVDQLCNIETKATIFVSKNDGMPALPVSKVIIKRSEPLRVNQT